MHINHARLPSTLLCEVDNLSSHTRGLTIKSSRDLIEEGGVAERSFPSD
jgi:hypothetical protein